MQFGQRLSIITLALVVANSCPSMTVNAWNFKLVAVRRNWFRRARTRSLIEKKESVEYQSSTLPEGKVDLGPIATISPPLIVNPTKASKWDLPRHSETSSDNITRVKLLWDMELFLGRTAMVGAMFLLFGEITSRESMTSQLASFTGNLDSVFAMLP
jgi:hypothetical protein